MYYLGTGVCNSNGLTFKFHLIWSIRCADLIADCTVFRISIATVIGPTPPGTGVMKPATSLAAAKSTSPTNFEPFVLFESIEYQ